MLALLPALAFILHSHPASASDPTCPVTFDGRVPPYAELKWFDTPGETPWAGIRPRYMKWSTILSFAPVPPSVFDADFGGKAMELRINQDSVIRPSNVGAQTGYRRTELIFEQNNGDDESARGVKTYHWSVRQAGGLNLTHEYVNVWHERKDGKGNHFGVHIGALVGKEKQYDSRSWKVVNKAGNVVWTTPMESNDWENFAVTLDYEKSTMRVYYSKGQQKLSPVTSLLPNENNNGGTFHLGILKKSTGAKDPTRDGYHENGFSESQIYGGVFIEDSKSGCVSGLKEAERWGSR